jgi:hypothetical protein
LSSISKSPLRVEGLATALFFRASPRCRYARPYGVAGLRNTVRYNYGLSEDLTP